MRYLLSFTIDGRDAKDFDDSVSLEQLENGHVLLGVHIADVGHYVRPGTALDREALRAARASICRAALPMLPEQLCNGVCSLRPNEDKFTMTALMEIDDAGRVVNERIARTITRSKARLVYDDVNALFNGSEQQQAAMAAVANGHASPDARAGRKLRARRQAKGCIDFEIEEPNFVLDENGEPVEIITRERGEAEMMIEDFMLAANECVARFAREKPPAAALSRP